MSNVMCFDCVVNSTFICALAATKIPSTFTRVFLFFLFMYVFGVSAN